MRANMPTGPRFYFHRPHSPNHHYLTRIAVSARRFLHRMLTCFSDDNL
uniref:Uncharacterized protein n=1 Tax=Parascaris univalens TaxID=6257 RepID=A0A915AWY5_PARUN